MSSIESVIDLLVETFPRLFKGRPPRVPSDLPQGWALIVMQLFREIDTLLTDREASAFEILQIKEKWGGLRVYWSLGGQRTFTADVHDEEASHRLELGPHAPTPVFERIRDRVLRAEDAAASTCQRCSKPGRRRNQRGWLVTLCEGCTALKRDDPEDPS